MESRMKDGRAAAKHVQSTILPIGYNVRVTPAQRAPHVST